MSAAKKRQKTREATEEKRGYPTSFDVSDDDNLKKFLVERKLFTMTPAPKLLSDCNIHCITPPKPIAVPLEVQDMTYEVELRGKIEKITALKTEDFWNLFKHMEEKTLKNWKEQVSELVTKHHLRFKEIGILGHEEIFAYIISACELLENIQLPQDSFDNTRATQKIVKKISWDTFFYFLRVDTATGFLAYDPFNQSNDFFSKQLDDYAKASKKNRLERLISHAHSEICAWIARNQSEKTLSRNAALQSPDEMETEETFGLDWLCLAAQNASNKDTNIQNSRDSNATPSPTASDSQASPSVTAPIEAKSQALPQVLVVEKSKKFADMILTVENLKSRKDHVEQKKTQDFSSLLTQPTSEAKMKVSSINRLKTIDKETQKTLLGKFIEQVNEKQVTAALEAMQLIMEPTVSTAFLSSYPGFGKTRAALLIASMLFTKFQNSILVVFMAYQLMQQWQKEIETMFGDDVYVKTYTEAVVRDGELLDVEPMDKPQFLIMPISLFDDMPSAIEVCDFLQSCAELCAVFTDEVDVRGRKANQFTFTLGSTISTMKHYAKPIRLVHISGTPAHKAENCLNLCKISGVRPEGDFKPFLKEEDCCAITKALMVGEGSSSVDSKVPPFAAYAVKVPLDLENPLAASHRAQLHGNGQDNCGKFTYATKFAEEWCKSNQGSAMVVFENKQGLCTIATKLREILGEEKIILITGDIPEKDRATLLERAKTEQNRVILITPQLGGSGLNLQPVTLIVTIPAYSEQLEEQLIARAYRNGQDKTVLVLFLVCGDKEDNCMKLQLEKANSVSFLYDKEKKVKNLGSFSTYEPMAQEQVPEFLDSAYYLAKNRMACPGICFGVYPRSMIGNNDESSIRKCKDALRQRLV